jgi:tetratricopeptide (TPR) repeat protein
MYATVAFPEKYPALKNLIRGNGDKAIGLNMLRISAKRAAYASVEAKYALLDFLTNFEKNWTESLQIAQELNATYPDNPLFHRYLAQSYYMTRNFLAADSAYVSIIRRTIARQNGYEATMLRRALYYVGDIRLRIGKHESAVKHFKHAIEQGKNLDGREETVWMALSYLKLGNAYDVMGKRDDAVRAYKQVLSLDEHPFEGKTTHTLAEIYLAKPYKQ